MQTWLTLRPPIQITLLVYWWPNPIYQETKQKSLRVLNEAFIKVQNVHLFFYFTVSQKNTIHPTKQNICFGGAQISNTCLNTPSESLWRALPITPLQGCENVSARKGGPAVGWQRHRPRRFHGISGSIPCPASSGPSFKGGYFCSSTDQPVLVFIIDCV